MPRSQRRLSTPHSRNASREGFSLIELAVVIAIIAILVAIAIPLYLRYIARTQSTEALTLLTTFKPAVTRYYAHHGSFTGITGNKSLGMPPPNSITGKYVRKVQIDNVTERTLDITAIFCRAGSKGCNISKALSGQTLHLTAFAPGGKTGSIRWLCWINDKSEYAYVPPSCRHTHPKPAGH